jgi:hypothetical protein
MAEIENAEVYVDDLGTIIDSHVKKPSGASGAE